MQYSMSQSVIPHTGSQAKLGFQPVDTVAELTKRQKQLELQRELLQQIDDKQRQKEEGKIRSKRERELEEIRVMKEREEMERKLLDEMNLGKLEARNLQETNLEASRLREIKKMNILKIQNELLEQQQLRLANQKGRPKRVRTPVEDADRAFHNEKDYQTRTLIEQRIIRELPVEVEKTVRDTVNVELQRLRGEMSLQTNQLAEQLVQLKGQFLKANEAKQANEQQINRLKDELKQTQIVDEIRQRELYNAFLGEKKNKIIVNSTERLLSPNTVDFKFPKRPRPYYNLSDPYFGSQDEVNKDIHSILSDSTQMIPLTHDYGKDRIFNDTNILTRYYQSPVEIEEGMRRAKHLEQTVEIPEDFYNRQKLYVPKRKPRETPQQYKSYDYATYEYEYPDLYDLKKEDKKDSLSLLMNNNYVLEEDEIKDVLKGYEEKYQQLDAIDATRSQRAQNLNQLDDALTDLILQQSTKFEQKEAPKQFEYNDYYFPDYHDLNIYNKLDQIYAK